LSEPGDVVANAAFTGVDAARGIFGNADTVGLGGHAGLPVSSGVILSSGDIALAKGPNNQPGATLQNGADPDVDLDNLFGATVSMDAAVLEFDMKSQSGNLEFKFIFASEEYLEYVGSEFNDAFAVFVDGQNIAWAPSTTDKLISVNTISDSTRSDYFTHNEGSPVFNLQYDGFTTSALHPYLTATASVTPGTTHHIKLVLADASDRKLDSAVFIKNKRALPCP